MLERTQHIDIRNEHMALPWPSQLYQPMLSLLERIQDGEMDITAYDTAWAARLADIEPEIAQQALTWLREHQLADGSWGSSSNIYHHDRVICTLAAIIALAKNPQTDDNILIERGIHALQHHVTRLDVDGSGETIAFEFLVPTLMREYEALGLNSAGIAEYLIRYESARDMKLSKVPGNLIDRYVTMAFSAEMAGHDNHQILNLENLIESNGSVGLSPSATAYYLLEHNPNDQAARDYLRANFKDGGFTVIAPFDVFERTWVLWNLAITGNVTPSLRRAAARHVRFLKNTWKPGIGIGQSSPYSLCDGDDTAFVFELLCRFGEPPDMDALFRYEEDHYFRCFDHESNSSISTNIHMLGALLHAGLGTSHRSVRKVLKYLENSVTDGYWWGKWHASPYYPTSHLVISAGNHFPELVASTHHWLHHAQYTSGGWGYYGPTAEETAYALQALFALQEQGHAVSQDVLSRGVKWLASHDGQHHPHLWVGKCLYSPYNVIESSILSALMISHQHFPEVEKWLAERELMPVLQS